MITPAQVEYLGSRIAGTPITITCDVDPSYAQGFVMVGAHDNRIHLNPDVCYALQHPMADPYLTGKAALALTHEAYHIRLNSEDEGDVECHAITDTVWTVRVLMGDRSDMTRRGYGRVTMSRFAVGAAYAYHYKLPLEYRTSC